MTAPTDHVSILCLDQTEILSIHRVRRLCSILFPVLSKILQSFAAAPVYRPFLLDGMCISELPLAPWRRQLGRGKPSCERYSLHLEGSPGGYGFNGASLSPPYELRLIETVLCILNVHSLGFVLVWKVPRCDTGVSRSFPCASSRRKERVYQNPCTPLS
jgi:hypothetical protein